MSDSPQPANPQFANAVQSLLQRVGRASPITMHAITAGRNNRVYCVEGSFGRVVLKQFFTQLDDVRDRMRADVGFTRFAWDHGMRQVAEPLAEDAVNRLALFEWIAGRRLTAAELSDEHVFAAVEFFRDLNVHRDDPSANALPSASEACFSVAEHLRCVERRVRTLATLNPCTPLHTEAADLVHAEIMPVWTELSNRVMDEFSGETASVLPTAARCLSPSDFGFHNALLDESGRLRFFDFEYAGWDDPAKLICDFFCQPEVPVPLCYLDEMTERIAATIPAAVELRARVRTLLPIYRIKWCTIVMNEFLPANAQRRRFSGTEIDSPRLRTQLELARRLLASISD